MQNCIYLWFFFSFHLHLALLSSSLSVWEVPYFTIVVFLVCSYSLRLVKYLLPSLYTTWPVELLPWSLGLYLESGSIFLGGSTGTWPGWGFLFQSFICPSLEWWWLFLIFRDLWLVISWEAAHLVHILKLLTLHFIPWRWVVPVHSDNSTVFNCITKQGGTKFRSLDISCTTPVTTVEGLDMLRSWYYVSCDWSLAPTKFSLQSSPFVLRYFSGCVLILEHYMLVYLPFNERSKFLLMGLQFHTPQRREKGGCIQWR